MLRPLNDFLLVRPEEDEENKVGSIFIPQNMQTTSKMGTVLAVGPGRETDSGHLIKLNVNEGDRVLFNVYAGHELSHGSEKMVLLRESDLFGVVDA